MDRPDVGGVPAARNCNILLDHSMHVWGTSATPLSIAPTGLASPVRLGPYLLPFERMNVHVEGYTGASTMLHLPRS